MLENKLKIYETIYCPPARGEEGFYFTKISEADFLDFSDKIFFRCKLRIQKTNYNNAILNIFLTKRGSGMDFSAKYTIVGEDKIRNFLEDMQVLEPLNGEEIPSLKNRTLEGIFDNNSGEFCALCVTLPFKYNLSQNLSRLIKDEVQNQIDNFKINEINKELGDEDYWFAEGLRDKGLVDENYLLIEGPKKEDGGEKDFWEGISGGG